MEDIDLDILDDFFDEDVEFNLYEIFKISHVDKMYKSLQKLIQAYKQDEKVINEMAIELYSRDFAIDYCITDEDFCDGIIEYFRKECE